MKRAFNLAGLVLCSILQAQSQSLYVGVGGGYSVLESQDRFTTTIYDGAFAWQTEVKVVRGQKPDDGFNLVSQLKLGISNSPLQVIAAFSYTRLHSESDSATTNVPPWSEIADESGRLDTRSSVFSLGASVDWEVLVSPMIPYVSLGFALNRFGETEVKIANRFVTKEFSVEGKTRLGLSLGAGIRSDVLRSIGLDLQVTYLLNNLVGRQDGELVQNGVNVGAALFYRLF